MRDYYQVNEERYEKDKFSGKAVEHNIYASINPIGNYGVYKMIQHLRKFILMVRNTSRKPYDEITFLDCGCGTGLWTRTAANMLESPENVYGFEFSRNRLRHCRKMNPAIHYVWGDIVGGVPEEFMHINFDGIVAVDLLSQIRKKEDVITSITNIRKALSIKGLFLWYEINAKTHEMNYDLDTQGFSEKEMDDYAAKCGLELVYTDRAYGAFTFLGHKYSTYYNINDGWRGIRFMEFIEPILLMFGHLNNIRIYRKADET